LNIKTNKVRQEGKVREVEPLNLRNIL